MYLGRWITFLGSLSILRCRLLNMGGCLSKPEETPLEYILKNWKLKFYCKSAWPLYKLGDGKWPENGYLAIGSLLPQDGKMD